MINKTKVQCESTSKIGTKTNHGNGIREWHSKVLELPCEQVMIRPLQEQHCHRSHWCFEQLKIAMFESLIDVWVHIFPYKENTGSSFQMLLCIGMNYENMVKGIGIAFIKKCNWKNKMLESVGSTQDNTQWHRADIENQPYLLKERGLELESSTGGTTTVYWNAICTIGGGSDLCLQEQNSHSRFRLSHASSKYRHWANSYAMQKERSFIQMVIQKIKSTKRRKNKNI